MAKTKGFDIAMKKLEVDLDKITDNLLPRVGKFIYNDVKINTPVDTGALRRGWKMKREGDSVKIYNNTSYAIHVEHGHRVRSSAKNLRYDAKTRSFSNQTATVPARHMLRNAVERGKILLGKELTEIDIFGGDK